MNAALIRSILDFDTARSEPISALRGGTVLAVLLYSLLAAPVVSAQSPSSPTATRDTTAEEAATSWYAFPTLFFTPETSLGGGAAAGYFFPLSTGHPSSVQGDVSATLRGQYQLNVVTELYLSNGSRRLVGELSLVSFPDVFYGIGPQTTDAMEEEYESRFVDAVVQLEQRVTEGMRIGLRARLRHEAITEVEDGGLLDGPAVPGTDGGTAVGVGPIATWDTRDRVFYPHRGQFVTAYGLVHAGAVGSTFDFARGVLDARQYIPIGPGQVVALQGYAEATSGTAPFTMLPQLGGMLRMRGYREGRFRDDVMATAQAEWRFPVWWRFDGALFAGTGAVSARIGTFGAEGLEVAGGAGLRFRLNDAGVHLRLDYALGREGGGLYITAAQPF